MRNFWIECEIDGKKTKLASGPRAKDGGMHIELFQRIGGESVKIVDIECQASEDEYLQTFVSTRSLQPTYRGVGDNRIHHTYMTPELKR